MRLNSPIISVVPAVDGRSLAPVRWLLTSFSTVVWSELFLITSSWMRPAQACHYVALRAQWKARRMVLWSNAHLP
jgi:hypothetical protein